MRRTDTRLRLCGLLLLLNLAFIWGNSMMNADLSDAFSRWAHQLLALLFPHGGIGTGEGGHGLLRKLAHFTEFACLGMLLTWLLGMLGRRRFPLGALGLGVGAACVDECIQLFSPGRSCQLSDVLIDSAGVALGAGILLLAHTVITLKKTKDGQRSSQNHKEE